jgi:hypothetical protein
MASNAFLAERRGVERVLAVDNEQYRLWSLPAGESSWRGRGISREPSLAGLGGRVSADGRVRARRSRRAFRRGNLHRVENPLGLLRVPRERTVSRGTVLIGDVRAWPGAAGRCRDSALPAGEVYARDEFVYWAFADADLERLARIAGFSEVGAVPLCAGCRPPTDHRAAGRLTAPGRRPHDFFTSWSQTRNARESAVSQIGDRASGDRRAPSSSMSTGSKRIAA